MPRGGVGGGEPKSSSATALTVVRGRSIVQGGLDQSSKVIELHGGFARFIFTPRVIPNQASPAVYTMSGTTSVTGTRG